MALKGFISNKIIRLENDIIHHNQAVVDFNLGILYLDVLCNRVIFIHLQLGIAAVIPNSW